MRPGDGTEYREITPDSGGNPVLVVLDGPNTGETIPLTSSIISFGRQPDNDIVLDEAAVSRRHATIVMADGEFHLRDLDSANGTYLNRQRISASDRQTLNHGDLIRLGGSEVSFMFQHAGARTVKLELDQPPSEAVVVDHRARHVYVRGQRLDPPMTRKEFDLVMLLDDRRSEAVSRDDIAKQVWPERPDGDVGNHEIEQCVHRVRARMEEDPSKPVYVVTVRGFGYKLN